MEGFCLRLPLVHRLKPWQQMDIEYTFWQMLHLCTAPKPSLAVATIAYCAAYDHSAVHAVFVVISVLLFHFLFTGVFLATCCWFLTNAYLREEAPNSHVVEQWVEWQRLNCPIIHVVENFILDSLGLGALAELTDVHENVKELVYKKGYARIDKKAVPLTDNNIIEQEVVLFMGHLMLSKPEDRLLRGKKQPYREGGDAGNREDEINDLINKMN
ncbi:hypothetical protein J1N35_015736 [Gossypium stocksii]|uniref:Uncharacterized protein n=1 Tax=Gossypium stocksii TaxID=47602 RepID=A0A9D3VWR8_9ROSI|nr:hypothetical protein J1N35_015736 [Gossypium stocksii]